VTCRGSRASRAVPPIRASAHTSCRLPHPGGPPRRRRRRRRRRRAREKVEGPPVGGPGGRQPPFERADGRERGREAEGVDGAVGEAPRVGQRVVLNKGDKKGEGTRLG
jgi:hypothetical protein